MLELAHGDAILASGLLRLLRGRVLLGRERLVELPFVRRRWNRAGLNESGGGEGLDVTSAIRRGGGASGGAVGSDEAIIV